MSDQTLKPCPCCGNIEDVDENPHMYEIDDWGNKSEMGVVHCWNCGIMMEAGSGQAAAVERWNRRKPVDALIEALKIALDDLINNEFNDEWERGRCRSLDQMEEQEAWSKTIYEIREAIKKAGGES